MKRTKILITGGTGFLGTEIKKQLNNKKKYKIFSCSRKNGVDLRNYKLSNIFFNKIKPDIVIHCAAHVGGIQYDAKYPIEIYEDNLKIGTNLIKLITKNNVKKLINIMPNCAYPHKFDKYIEKNWWDGELHSSIIMYAMPRKIMETTCFVYLKKYNFHPLHVVLPNLYGPGDHFEPVKSHVLGALINKIVKAKMNNIKEVEIWGSGKPIREWLYVKDAANAIYQIVNNVEIFKKNEIINVGTESGVSVKNLAETIKKITKWNGKFIYNRKMQDGSKIKILSSKKMNSFIKWKPKTTLIKGLKETIKFYNINYKKFQKY